MEEKDLRSVVREKYGAVAEAGGATELGKQGCCTYSGCGCEGPGLTQLGYTPEQAAAIPEGADLGLGCGNPLGHAAVKPGETVLDLGSGAGIDAFLAARDTGPTGRVIGVDMTAAMLERARANAAKVHATNVEFRLGEIENLPVADGTVDVIISNCVVNLSPHKDRVFREALRVLKPGGRLVVSDLVWLREAPQKVRDSIEALVGCVAGASLKEEYLGLIRGSGFRDVEVLEQKGYQNDATRQYCGEEFSDAVVSVKVRAFKP
ncbi:MAG: arsenite methyltransferase [Candidatus Eisenbacteria bacterium]|nr:arsenite methyltransferase [Candidatus Eisenbacteria bacterium]